VANHIDRRIKKKRAPQKNVKDPPGGNSEEKKKKAKKRGRIEKKKTARGRSLLTREKTGKLSHALGSIEKRIAGGSREKAGGKFEPRERESCLPKNVA